MDAKALEKKNKKTGTYNKYLFLLRTVILRDGHFLVHGYGVRFLSRKAFPISGVSYG